MKNIKYYLIKFIDLIICFKADFWNYKTIRMMGIPKINNNIRVKAIKLTSKVKSSYP